MSSIPIHRFNLEVDELSEDEVRKYSRAPVRKLSRTSSAKKGRHVFIGGPFPWAQYRLAASLPGAALVLWQLIHHQSRMRKAEEVTLPRWMLDDIGIGRETKRRALQALERVGLIRIRQSGEGRSVRLSLIALPDSEGAPLWGR
jgi:hypothetical protein